MTERRSPIPLSGVKEQSAPSGSVATGALLSWTLEKGRRIRSVWLEFLAAAGTVISRANIASEIASVEMKASSSRLVDLATPAQIFALMNYLGTNGTDAAADDGVLRLDLAHVPGAFDPNYPAGGQGIVDGEALALGTVGLGAVQVFVRCGTISTVAQVRCYVDYGDGDEEPGYVRRVKVSAESGWGTTKKSLGIAHRAPVVQTPAGEKAIPDRLLCLHLTGYGSGVLSDVEIYQGTTLVQKLPATVLARSIRRNHRTAQSGYYSIELSRDRTILGGLPMDPDNPPRIDLTWSTQPDSNQFTAILDGCAYWHGGNAG